MTTQTLPSLSLVHAFLAVAWRRLQQGPLYPGWTWKFELQTHLRRARQLRPSNLGEIAQERSRLHSPPPIPFAGIQVRDEEVRMGGSLARWIEPTTRGHDVLVFYLPGGGYSFSSYDQYRLAAWVAEAVCARTLVLEYRLAPEFPFPNAVEDALEAYRGLLNLGFHPTNIVFAGDGAGGGLALATLLSLRYAHLPAPALAVLLSPWVDLSASGGSLVENAPYDWVDPLCLSWGARLYLHGADPHTPLASPLWADLSGLPPLYIQAGRAELLYDQILDLAHRAHSAGVGVQLDVWEGMNHTFQLAGNSLQQSRDALRRIGLEVAKRQLSHSPSSRSSRFQRPYSPKS